jgi:hypothetical protein
MDPKARKKSTATNYLIRRLDQVARALGVELYGLYKRVILRRRPLEKGREGEISAAVLIVSLHADRINQHAMINRHRVSRDARTV